MSYEKSATAYAKRAPGPITAAFQRVSNEVGRLSTFGILDEESLTSSILGGLTIACTWMIEKHGSGTVHPRQCSWGPYSKSGHAGTPQSEATSGADFALVLWESERWARIAIFQAKKGCVQCESGATENDPKKWFIDVHRLPKKPKDPNKNRRPSQLAALIDTGRSGVQECLRAIEGESADVQAAVRAQLDSQGHGRVKGLGWIHYLAYIESAPICVPITVIDEGTIARAFEPMGGQSLVPVAGDLTTTLFDLVRAGLSEAAPNGWIRLDVRGVETVIGELVDLMPVVVGDEESGKPLTPVQDQGGVQTGVAQPVSPSAEPELEGSRLRS